MTLILALATQGWAAAPADSAGLSLRMALPILEADAALGVRERVPVGIQDAIRLALERNLDLAIQRLNVPIAHEQIRQAEGDFDPLIGVGSSYGQQKRYPNSTLEQSAQNDFVREQTLSPNASLTGKLSTGTQYDFSLTGPYTKSDNPLRLFDNSYQATLGLTLTQPLLKGFGFEVNLVNIHVAEKGERQAASDVETKMLEVMRDVEMRYWTLFYAQEHVQVAQGNLDLAEDLVRRLERGLGSGLATALDVLQAKAAAEARRADVARARADLASARANLRLLVSPKDERALPLYATEGPAEDGPPTDLQAYVDRAAAQRPEIRSQELAIEKLSLQEVQAQDNTRPSLNLLGSVGYAGLSGTTPGPGLTRPLEGSLADRNGYLDAWRGLFTPAGPFNWSVGLQLQFPIGNRQALAVLVQTRLRRQQEEDRLALLKSQIGVDVETAFQDTSAGWAQLVGAREGVRLAREQLNATERNRAAGLATVRQVLEAQQNLGNALDVQNGALTTYAVSRSRLEAASTASFQRYHLVMQP